MTVLTATAPGKVNLCLYVARPRRRDGLHPVVTVMQSLTLADELRLEAAGAGVEADEVICPGVEGPNLAGRALAAYREATGWDAPPQRLTIVKRVPVAAGMGGGSADAAAALRLAAHAAGRPAERLLYRLARSLGSDVPSQLVPGRTLATGVGDQVRALSAPMSRLGYVVVPQDVPLTAAEVYREADRLGSPRSRLELGDLNVLVHTATRAGLLPADLLLNDLEAAARSLCPAIGPALEALRAAGADRALVTGSGPTAVGLFTGPDGRARAREAAAALRDTYPLALAAEAAGPDAARVTEAPVGGVRDNGGA